MSIIWQQIFLSGLVGAVGVAFDAGLFLWLVKHRLQKQLICANVISTTCAMMWTFVANWILVFRSGDLGIAGCVGRFLAITCFSGWVLQSATLRLGKSLLPMLLRRFQDRSITLLFVQHCDADGALLKVAKLTAIMVGFVWNFFWYRNWVYAK